MLSFLLTFLNCYLFVRIKKKLYTYMVIKSLILLPELFLIRINKLFI